MVTNRAIMVGVKNRRQQLHSLIEQRIEQNFEEQENKKRS